MLYPFLPPAPTPLLYYTPSYPLLLPPAVLYPLLPPAPAPLPYYTPLTPCSCPPCCTIPPLTLCSCPPAVLYPPLTPCSCPPAVSPQMCEDGSMDYESYLSSVHTAFQTCRDETITKWNTKTRIAGGKVTSKVSCQLIMTSL